MSKDIILGKFDRVEYELPAGKNPELHIMCDDVSKPWTKVDMVLNDLGVDRDTIEGTVYEYVYDEKKGRMIMCRITFKSGTGGMLAGVQL